MQAVKIWQKIGREKKRKIMPTSRTYQHEFKTPKNTIFKSNKSIFRNFAFSSLGHTLCLPFISFLLNLMKKKTFK